MLHIQTWELDEPWHVFQFCVEQLWSRSGSCRSSSRSGFKERHCGYKKKKGLLCCSRVSSDTYSDKLCVCESWCRLPVIMLESSLPRPAVVFLTSSAPRHFPCGKTSRQILLLRQPFFYGSLFFFCFLYQPMFLKFIFAYCTEINLPCFSTVCDETTTPVFTVCNTEVSDTRRRSSCSGESNCKRSSVKKCDDYWFHSNWFTVLNWDC